MSTPSKYLEEYEKVIALDGLTSFFGDRAQKAVNLSLKIPSKEYFVLGNKPYIKPLDILDGFAVLKTEIKELNKLLCDKCDEKNYEKCKSCKVYVLVNSLVS